jgi:predicted regulator of Ras-like GTPase activity (Roadblock/LC7/MglB family)
VDAAAALADLTEISSQVETAAVFGDDGTTHASTFADAAAAERLVGTARELLAAARELPAGTGRELTQLEVGLAEGSVFVVREGELAIAATTSARPTAGLVLYDLRTCLRTVAAAKKPKQRRARKPADA